MMFLQNVRLLAKAGLVQCSINGLQLAPKTLIYFGKIGKLFHQVLVVVAFEHHLIGKRVWYNSRCQIKIMTLSQTRNIFIVIFDLIQCRHDVLRGRLVWTTSVVLVWHCAEYWTTRIRFSSNNFQLFLC
jgi:hypothetical protein